MAIDLGPFLTVTGFQFGVNSAEGSMEVNVVHRYPNGPPYWGLTIYEVFFTHADKTITSWANKTVKITGHTSGQVATVHIAGVAANQLLNVKSIKVGNVAGFIHNEPASAVLM